MSSKNAFRDTTKQYFSHSREERALRGPKNEEEEAAFRHGGPERRGFPLRSGVIGSILAASKEESRRRLWKLKLSGEKIENTEMKRNVCTYVYVWRTVGGLGAKEVELTKGETSISPRKSSPPFPTPNLPFSRISSAAGGETRRQEAGKEADKRRTRSGQRSGQEANKKKGTMRRRRRREH